MDPVRKAGSKVALAHRYHRDNPERIAAARRELAEANIERAINRALATAPPLTAEQRDRLAALLAGGGSR